jgi:hypothetical protein
MFKHGGSEGGEDPPLGKIDAYTGAASSFPPTKDKTSRYVLSKPYVDDNGRKYYFGPDNAVLYFVVDGDKVYDQSDLKSLGYTQNPNEPTVDGGSKFMHSITTIFVNASCVPPGFNAGSTNQIWQNFVNQRRERIIYKINGKKIFDF